MGVNSMPVLLISIHAPTRGATAKLDKMYLDFTAIITKIEWFLENMDLMEEKQLDSLTIFFRFSAPISWDFVYWQGRRIVITAKLRLLVPKAYAP